MHHRPSSSSSSAAAAESSLPLSTADGFLCGTLRSQIPSSRVPSASSLLLWGFPSSASRSFLISDSLSGLCGGCAVKDGVDGMIKYVANEPSVGLYFVQQHARASMPILLDVKVRCLASLCLLQSAPCLIISSGNGDGSVHVDLCLEINILIILLVAIQLLETHYTLSNGWNQKSTGNKLRRIDFF
jgi:hypothetical protein